MVAGDLALVYGRANKRDSLYSITLLIWIEVGNYVNSSRNMWRCSVRVVSAVESVHIKTWSHVSTINWHLGHTWDGARDWRHREAYIGDKPWISLIIEARWNIGVLWRYAWSARIFVFARLAVDRFYFLFMYVAVLLYLRLAWMDGLNLPMILWGIGWMEKIAHFSSGRMSGSYTAGGPCYHSWDAILSHQTLHVSSLGNFWLISDSMVSRGPFSECPLTHSNLMGVVSI